MPLLRAPREGAVDRPLIEPVWSVLPTFVCQCGWIGGINEVNQIYCDNRKCEHYGKLFTVEVITREVKAGNV